MTKQDFELIAKVLDDLPLTNVSLRAERAKVDFWVLVDRLAIAFATHHPRFDREKFVKACMRSKNAN